MTITITLRQQKAVKSSTYLVVNEISNLTGLAGPVADNLKLVFVVHRFGEEEKLDRVATLQDFVNLQPYPDPPSELKWFKSAALEGTAAIGWKIHFPTLQDVWVTTQSGSQQTYEIDGINVDGNDTVSLVDSLPSTLPGGISVNYQLLDNLDVLQFESAGVPKRTLSDADFRTSYMYSYFTTPEAATAQVVSVQTKLKSLVKQLNFDTDEDFDVVTLMDITGS